MKLQRCDSRSFSNSRNGEEEKSPSIPFDLVIEILTRLPRTSKARFRCVSKQWDSTIVSLYRPTLLLSCLKDGNTFFFSSPTPKDSSPLALNIHMSFPINRPREICRPVRGLVCGLNQQTDLKGNEVTVPWICNPSTGESLTLPRLKTHLSLVTSYLGYDPIGKQFKVLCMAHAHGTGTATVYEQEILTLQPGKKPSWRKVLCRINYRRLCLIRGRAHNTAYDGISINGVLYFLAYVVRGGGTCYIIVCFDFRSEKFKSIKVAQGMEKSLLCRSTLVDYKGKFALLQRYFVDEEYSGYQLWVLEDAKNQKWSNYIYVWPPRPPQEKTVEETLSFVGTSDTGEIVLSPKIISDSFYLIYYNPEKSTFTRVGIQGMEAFKDQMVYVVLDHEEDMRKVSRILAS